MLCRPLLIFGKGAAYAKADAALQSFVETTGIPFLGSAMGRGCVPDSHMHCVAAARSLALAQADVAVVVGARCALKAKTNTSDSAHGLSPWSVISTTAQAAVSITHATLGVDAAAR